jgi:hypothetical protein
MRHYLKAVAAVAVLGLSTAGASAQAVFDFEDGTDQGFGAGFGNDASATYPIDNVGGSNRMRVLDTAAFQQAGRETGNPADPMYQAMLAASSDEANYTISYDWYVDTSVNPGGGTSGTPWGSFLQIGTYVNTGNGYYAQDFPGVGKDVELNGTQLASGQVFSGTVTETFTAKGFDLPPAQTFFRLGLISNGDGTSATVHYDNITIVPEPAALALVGLAVPALAMRRGRRGM